MFRALLICLVFLVCSVHAAVDWEALKEAAEQGNDQAQFNLGLMYANGDGFPEDDTEAVHWYRKAAEQGNAWAQTGLGLMYANGEGVPEDDAEAVSWYRKAAEQGNAWAQYGTDKLTDLKLKSARVSELSHWLFNVGSVFLLQRGGNLR